ncbi:MAG: (2Fe-2S)-binding protein [Chitinophagales bacterium]|nr:(2Fe-2S)-binding protein [Bacteroidota bacterium]MBX7139749.1 (2Fe-2S)-binding protein [Chitinophagales bacterium]
MIKVTIDGIEIEVEDGTTIMNAARKVGGKIVPPAMCYYSTLKGSGGKCRACLVKVAQGSAKDPRPMPKLVASCSTAAQDGMVVQNITSQEVLDVRRGIVEMLLVNHPLDCPVCDQAGECELQNFAFDHGLQRTRSEFPRREFDIIDIGPHIKLHMTRCILCYRCTMVADQLTDQRVHGVLWRGEKSEISTYIQKAIENDFSGNMIDVCPVGALTDRHFRFRNRVWFLAPFDAHRHCTKCSGKAVVWLRGEEIYRVTGRKDEYGEVKDFICNECRWDHFSKTDWIIEGPRKFEGWSVINANKYDKETVELPEHLYSKLDNKKWETFEGVT